MIVRAVVQTLVGITKGEHTRPPRAVARTSWGLITIEACWLVPSGSDPRDVAADPWNAPITLHLELHEHALAYSARRLRQCGATPVQGRIGVLLATGKSKPEIAREIGIKPSSVADAARKLHERFNVHNPSELGRKLWLAGEE